MTPRVQDRQGRPAEWAPWSSLFQTLLPPTLLPGVCGSIFLGISEAFLQQNIADVYEEFYTSVYVSKRENNFAEKYLCSPVKSSVINHEVPGLSSAFWTGDQTSVPSPDAASSLFICK